jgi:hypothetical protein
MNMNPTFDSLYRQLGRATFGLLLATITSFGITLLCALLGLSRAVASLNGVSLSIASVFIVLLSFFLVASLVDAVIRWLDRRNQS